MKKTYKELSVYPKHIAFIMDGNGRWAKKRLMPRTFGHKNGCEAIIRVLRACREFNINYVSYITSRKIRRVYGTSKSNKKTFK